MVAGRQAGRHGAGAVAKSLHHDPQTGGRQTGEVGLRENGHGVSV